LAGLHKVCREQCRPKPDVSLRWGTFKGPKSITWCSTYALVFTREYKGSDTRFGSRHPPHTAGPPFGSADARIRAAPADRAADHGPVGRRDLWVDLPRVAPARGRGHGRRGRP